MSTAVWYVTGSRAPVDWASDLTAHGDAGFIANTAITRLVRDGDGHERASLFAAPGALVSTWAVTRAKQEQSADAVPAPYPLPTPEGGGSSPTPTGSVRWADITKPAGGIPASDIDTASLAASDAFRDRF